MELREMVDLLHDAGLLDEGFDADSTVEDYLPTRISTHIPTLDDALHGGFKPGLHCVTGWPASYKTATMLQVAYLAARDGHPALYITDEITKRECMERLTAMQMRLDGHRDAPAWVDVTERAIRCASEGDEEGASAIAEALRKVRDTDMDVVDMGPRMAGTFDWHKDYGSDFEKSYRYIPSTFIEYEACGCDVGAIEAMSGYELVVIDPVNNLRKWEDKEGSDTYRPEDDAILRRDKELTSQELMEEVVEALDRWARCSEVVVVGIFHASRDGNGTSTYQKPPSLGDFKGTSKIESQAISTLEFVRYSKMRWKGCPKAPFAPADGMEAVAVYNLKNRQGGEVTSPVTLVADGPHSMVWEWSP